MTKENYQPQQNYETRIIVPLGKGLIKKMGIKLDLETAKVRTTPSGQVLIEYSIK